MNKCECCGKETRNQKFCSKSCTAKINNAKFPKRKTTRKCTRCENVVKSYRHTLCAEHLVEWKQEQLARCPNTTLEDYWNKDSVKGKHASWKNGHIRILNRSWNKDLIKLPCANCGYDKHVELCHIKPIANFPRTALLSEVNGTANVIQLCPNCHWEFDHNRLTIEEIRKDT